jgi:hypothetical protein
VAELAGAVVLVTAAVEVGVEVAEPVSWLLLRLVEDERTESVLDELALELTELASLPPSPHLTTVFQPPAKTSSQYEDWVVRVS